MCPLRYAQILLIEPAEQYVLPLATEAFVTVLAPPVSLAHHLSLAPPVSLAHHLSAPIGGTGEGITTALSEHGIAGVAEKAESGRNTKCYIVYRLMD